MVTIANTEIFESKESVITALTQALHERICDKDTVLLLSGGSSISVSVAAISRLPVHDRERLHIGMTDERYGLYDHPDSNWRALREAGLLELGAAAYYPVLTEENLSLEASAERYARVLEELLSASANTIAIFGIGTDDHIAGMLPESVAVHERVQMVVGYDAGKFKRITMTPSALSRVHFACVYAQGEEKFDAVERLATVLDSDTHPNQHIKKSMTYTVFYCPEV